MESTTAAQPVVSFVAPISQKDRILFLDCIRGMALLGIIIMNITAQGQAGQLYDTMDVRLPLTGYNYYAWFIESFLFEGTMRGLFSILFGTGTLLLINRLQKNNSGLVPADIYYRRVMWMIVFGLINAYLLLWPGDILYPYGVAGLFLFPFRNFSAKKLLLFAFIALSIATYKEYGSLNRRKEVIVQGRAAEALVEKNRKLSDEQKEFLGKWVELKRTGTKDSIPARLAEEEKKIVNKNYAQIYKVYEKINIQIQSTGLYRFNIWDMLIFFFIGMALFKNGFITGAQPNKVYFITAIAGTGIGLWLNYLHVSLNYQVQFDLVKYTEKAAFEVYELRRVFQTVGYLSILILLYKVTPFKKIFKVLAPVGQMAFTNYLCQSIITSIVFYGFGLFAKLQRYELYYVVGSIWVFQIIFSHIWLHYFRMGPLEWIWRSLTYWKKQPLKKDTAFIE
jgi:uncharacterized protein